MLTKIVSNSLKTTDSYKFRQDASYKTRILRGNSLGVFGQFSENLKIHRKSWVSGFGLINENNFSKIVSKFSLSVNPI